MPQKMLRQQMSSQLDMEGGKRVRMFVLAAAQRRETLYYRVSKDALGQQFRPRRRTCRRTPRAAVLATDGTPRLQHPQPILRCEVGKKHKAKHASSRGREHSLRANERSIVLRRVRALIRQPAADRR